jgi:hypothetical protein
MDTTYYCAFCGSENDIEIDASAGTRQSYVEDCQTCCRPNMLTIHISADGEDATVEAQREND